MSKRKYPHGTEKENQIKRQNKFIAEAYDRFTLTFPKGKKEIYKAYAESRGMSLNGYINKLIADDMGEALTVPAKQQED